MDPDNRPSCIKCNKIELRPKDRFKVIPGSFFFQRVVAEVRCNLQVLNWICKRCRQRYKNNDRPSTRKPYLEPGGVVDVLKVGNTSARCIACKKTDQQRLKIPPKARKQAFELLNLTIPDKAKRCNRCIENNLWTDEALEHLKQLRPGKVTPATFKADCKQIYEAPLFKGRLNFSKDNPERTSKYCKLYLGLHALEFDTLFDKTKTFITGQTEDAKIRNLAIFLNKMRLNNPNTVIGLDFGLHEITVGNIIDSVSESLARNYVPKYLGFGHISFAEFKRDHSLTLADRLFNVQDDEVIVIADATYLYFEKSSNQKTQKRTFSSNKGTNLVKPTTLCSPDGYFLAVGPCFMTDFANNDASILNSMLLNPIGIRYFADGKRIKFILDRGYRDSGEDVQNLGWDIHMPSFRPVGKSQHTALESNLSRAVTKIRWVVEAAHGRIKKVFRIFQGENPNTIMDKIDKYWQICCAISNDYFCLLKEEDPESQNELADKMLNRMSMENELQSFLQEHGLIRSVKHFQVGTTDLSEFPHVTEKDIEELAFGVYQRKLAPSYAARKMEDDGFKYRQLKHRRSFAHRNIIRVEMKSKHSTLTKRLVFVEFEPRSVGRAGILGYYCSCLCGARTVGTCCHVAAVIYFFGYGRHLDVLPYPAKNIGATILDTRTVTYPDSEDEMVLEGASDVESDGE